jgi:hypothetical protein
MTPAARRYYLIALTGLCAVGAWLLYARTPAPGVPHAPVTARPAAPSSAPDSGANRYCLKDGEPIRYIADPTAVERERLRQQLRLEGDGPLVSVTLVWDGAPHLLSAEVGEPRAPRTLRAVLLQSLHLPSHTFENLGLADSIALPGDWILAKGVARTEHLAYIAGFVRATGHARFAFVREEQNAVFYVASGTPCPKDVFQLLPKPPGNVKMGSTDGTAGEFLSSLSGAIHRRIANELSDNAVRITWQDNSTVYPANKIAMTEERISTLLDQAASALCISFERLEEPATVWRLRDNCYAD